MITICLKYSTSQQQEAAVRTAVKYEIMFNPNLNGAEFEINRGYCNQMGVALLKQPQNS
jgi:hypothetical protein